MPTLFGEQGRRAEKTEYGLRTARDGVFRRKGHIEECSSLESALDLRERPFTGRRGDEEIVIRTIVTYTTQWTVVPGHDGSLWLCCNHPGTPQGRTGPSIFRDDPDCPVRHEGPDYQLPHAFRERDMTAGDDGVRRYTCPVCSLVWQPRRPEPPQPGSPAVPAADGMDALF